MRCTDEVRISFALLDNNEDKLAPVGFDPLLLPLRQVMHHQASIRGGACVRIASDPTCRSQPISVVTSNSLLFDNTAP